MLLPNNVSVIINKESQKELSVLSGDYKHHIVHLFALFFFHEKKKKVGSTISQFNPLKPAQTLTNTMNKANTM